MGYYRPGFYGLDPTVLLLVAGMVLSLLASARIPHDRGAGGAEDLKDGGTFRCKGVRGVR